MFWIDWRLVRKNERNECACECDLMLVNPVWEGVRLTERSLEGDLHPPARSECPRGWRAEGFPQRSVFARRAPTNVSVGEKKSPSFATLASTFRNSTFPKARAETRPSFVMSRRVSEASPSLGSTPPTRATPSGAPGQGFVPPGGTDAQPLFWSCVRFLLAAS